MKLASIEIIKSLCPHPNADKLELAQVLGWQVVVQKGIHKQGDKVVFIPIDTILPKCSWSEFLVDKENPDKPIRLKMKKLRGEHSAGIILPLSEFEPKNDQEVAYDLKSCEVGYDLTDNLGVKKYIKELPAHLQGENVGDFPTHICSKTDEDNGLSDLELVQKVISNNEVVVTQKIDGTSVTIIFENGEITQVCSRNLSKKETPNSAYWAAARKLNVVPGFTGVIQGELAGNGIQKNPLRLDDRELFVFQVKNHEGNYLNYQAMKGLCNVEFGCKVVPLVWEGSFVGATVQEALNKLQELADQQFYTKDSPAEGIVVRPKESLKQFGRPLGFKILNRNYKDN
jgi:RNA ligase (TIGR02306 family)